MEENENLEEEIDRIFTREEIQEIKKDIKNGIKGCFASLIGAGVLILAGYAYIDYKVDKMFGSKKYAPDIIDKPTQNKKTIKNLEKNLENKIENNIENKINKSKRIPYISSSSKPEEIRKYLEIKYSKEFAEKNFELYNNFFKKEWDVKFLDRYDSKFLDKNRDSINMIIKKYDLPESILKKIDSKLIENKKLVKVLTENCNKYALTDIPKKLFNHEDLLINIAKNSKDNTAWIYENLDIDQTIKHKDFYMELFNHKLDGIEFRIAKKHIKADHLDKYKNFMIEYTKLVKKDAIYQYNELPFHLWDKHKDFLLQLAKIKKGDAMTVYKQLNDDLLKNKKFLLDIIKNIESNITDAYQYLKEITKNKNLEKSKNILIESVKKAGAIGLGIFEDIPHKYTMEFNDFMVHYLKNIKGDKFQFIGMSIDFFENFEKYTNFIRKNKKYALNLTKQGNIAHWKLLMLSEAYNSGKDFKKLDKRMDYLIKECKKHHDIDNPQRYDIGILEELLKNRDKNYNREKPIALFLMNKSDFNRVFDSNTRGIVNQLSNYKVLIYEGDNEEIAEKIKYVYETQNRKISGLFFGGHGKDKEIQYGSGKDEKNYIDINDKNELSKFNDYLEKYAKVISISCLNGKGGKKAKNIANFLAKEFKGHKIYTAIEKIYAPKMKLIMEKGYIKDVDFGVPKYIALEMIK